MRTKPGTLPPGVYATPTGYRVVAVVSRTQRQEKRFPAGTALRTLVRWQADAKVELRKTPPPDRAGLAAAVARYLETRTGMPTYGERERHLELWTHALGAARDPRDVTALDVRAQLERWAADRNWTRATCNRLRTALLSFYSTIYGKSGYNPVRDVRRAREPQKPPKPFSYVIYRELLRNIPAWPGFGRTPSARLRQQMLARLDVMAYVGLPQAQIKLLRPSDLVSSERMLYVHGRSKGHGTDDVWLPLSHAGLSAVQAFFACGAEGSFRNETLRDLFRAGAMAIGRPDLTPYDLRHLFGTTVLRLSKNRAATRDLMQHTDDATTARYAKAAIPVELRAAIDAFDAEVVAPRIGAEDAPITQH